MNDKAALLIWIDTTRNLLRDAIKHRDAAALRRAAIRIDSARMNDCPDDTQEELLDLYAQAMSANGAYAP